MSLVKWSKEISVGIETLDDEHKRMVEMLNDFYDSIREDRGLEVVGDILDSLTSYAIMHFKHEEDLFVETAYPDFEDHKKHHQEAMQQILDIQKRFHNGASLELCHELFQFLTGWLDKHVIELDQKYTTHLKTYGIR